MPIYVVDYLTNSVSMLKLKSGFLVTCPDGVHEAAWVMTGQDINKSVKGVLL